MKSLYKFDHYREFLSAAFLEAKRSNSRLTVERYAEKLGIGKSTFKMIISGRRRLTLSKLHQIASELKLSTKERSYLEAIVLRERSKAPTERAFYSKRAVSVKKGARLESVNLSKKELLSDPFTLPILVYLTDLKRLSSLVFPLPKKEIDAISRSFGIEVHRVETAIGLLCAAGVIQEQPLTGEIHFVFDKLNNVFSQKQYIKNWLTLSQQAAEKLYTDDNAFFNSTSLSISQKSLLELRSELKSVLDKYMSITNKNLEKNMIVQVGIQLFPILHSDR